MALARSEAVATLKRVGLADLAASADRELPDPVADEELVEWAARHGVTREWLMDRLGGSP